MSHAELVRLINVLFANTCADEKMNAEPSSPGSKDSVAGDTRKCGTEESLSSKEDDRPPLHSLSRYPVSVN